MIWSWFARLLGSPTTTTHPGGTSAPDATDLYLLPRSQEEQDRLELQHYALRRLLGGHLLAPVAQPRQLLDVGAGTGIWLREAARRWPSARLVALDKDLSLLRHCLPPRCQPVQADLLHGLPFPDASFDYVHQRLLAAAIPATAWPQVLAELVRVTAPGGWLELLEVTGEMEREGPLQRQVRGWLSALLEQRGLALEATLQLPAWLADLGLSPRVHRFLMPLWGRRQGAPLFRRDALSALQTLAPLLAAANHVPLSLVQERLTALPAEWEHCRTSAGGIALCVQRPWEPAAPTRGGAP